jgi:hypothetical protein
MASNWDFLDNISTSSTDNPTADDVRACVDAAGDMGTTITGAAGIDVDGNGNVNGNDSNDDGSENSSDS